MKRALEEWEDTDDIVSGLIGSARGAGQLNIVRNLEGAHGR